MTRELAWGLFVCCSLWVVFAAALGVIALVADRLPDRFMDFVDRHLSGEW